MDIDKILASKIEELKSLKKKILDLDEEMNEKINVYKAKKNEIITHVTETQGIVKFLEELKASNG